MDDKQDWFDGYNDFVKSAKVKGKCSFCSTEMKPVYVVGLIFNRDICVCDNKECREFLQVCLKPGCDNYAKSGILPRPLCKWCLEESVPPVAKTILKAVGMASTAGLTLYVKNKMSDK